MSPLFSFCILDAHQQLQGFRKFALFRLLLTKFFKSTCLFLAIFLKFIFNQKEKRGFIWAKKFRFIQKKELFLERSCSEFQKYKKK